MRVAIVGTGYVGLVSGACLADLGHEVICVDIDQAKVAQINRGESPIYEPGLDELVKRHAGKKLVATCDLEKAVAASEMSIIAVGTPFDGSHIDLQFVTEAASQIGRALKAGNKWHSVIVKSTVVPGTTNDVVLPALENASGMEAGKEFGVGMNPEFLREGEAIGDFMNPDRLVLGGSNERTHEDLKKLYQVFPEVDKLVTDCRTAEMIKYAANSLLATMISFSNEMGRLCAVTPGVDVREVMEGVHADRRLSPIDEEGIRIRPGFINYLEAGCGFGGSCFPKDVKALTAHGESAGIPMHILNAVIQTNKNQPLEMVSILKSHFQAPLNGKKVLVLGLAFKPGTDDIRESPSIPVMESLLKEKAEVTCFDPVASDAMKAVFNDDQVVYEDDLGKAVAKADAILLMTRWKEFSSLPDIINSQNPEVVFVDGRRMLSPAQIKNYHGIGIGPEVCDSHT